MVLDTNVLSELMRPRPNPQVLARPMATADVGLDLINPWAG